MNYHDYNIYNTNPGLCRFGGIGENGHENGIFIFVVGTGSNVVLANFWGSRTKLSLFLSA